MITVCPRCGNELKLLRVAGNERVFTCRNPACPNKGRDVLKLGGQSAGTEGK